MRLWLLSGVDSWFFRGARSFRAGEGGVQHIASLFPPSITTLQGLVRLTLAMGKGWTPNQPATWPKEELGDEENLGKLRLQGPFLRYDERWLFPVPLHLMKDKNGKLSFLTPSKDKYLTDLGEIRLPAIDKGGVGNVTGYVTREGMSAILAGELSIEGELREASKLWDEEYRVGIEIESNTKTAADQMLYSIRHIRPEESLQLGVLTKGEVPEAWFPKEKFLVPFGGEGRLAEVEVKESEALVPKMPKIQGGERLRIIATLITPGRYDYLGDSLTAPDKLVGSTKDVVHIGPFFGEGITCITACVGKLQQVGGWDLKNQIPRPLVPIIPPGSTWFYELSKEEFEIIKKYHGQPTGPYAEYGYGQVVLGIWKEEDKNDRNGIRFTGRNTITSR